MHALSWRLMTLQKIRVSGSIHRTLTVPGMFLSALSIELGVFLPSRNATRNPTIKETISSSNMFNDNLILSWELYDKLRVGTVVLVETTLVCCISQTAMKWIGVIENRYIHHRYPVTLLNETYSSGLPNSRPPLRILSESDEIVEPRNIPVLIRPSAKFKHIAP